MQRAPRGRPWAEPEVVGPLLCVAVFGGRPVHRFPTRSWLRLDGSHKQAAQPAGNDDPLLQPLVLLGFVVVPAWSFSKRIELAAAFGAYDATRASRSPQTLFFCVLGSHPRQATSKASALGTVGDFT